MYIMSEYHKCARETGKCVGLGKGIKAYHECAKKAKCKKEDRLKMEGIKQKLKVATAKKTISKVVNKEIKTIRKMSVVDKVNKVSKWAGIGLLPNGEKTKDYGTYKDAMEKKGIFVFGDPSLPKKLTAVKKPAPKPATKKATKPAPPTPVKGVGKKEQEVLMGFVKALNKYAPLSDKTYTSVFGGFTTKKHALDKLEALIRDFLDENNQTDIANIMTLNKADEKEYEKILGLAGYDRATKGILHSKMYKYYFNKIEDDEKKKLSKPKPKSTKPKKYAGLFK